MRFFRAMSQTCWSAFQCLLNVAVSINRTQKSGRLPIGSPRTTITQQQIYRRATFLECIIWYRFLESAWEDDNPREHRRQRARTTTFRANEVMRKGYKEPQPTTSHHPLWIIQPDFRSLFCISIRTKLSSISRAPPASSDGDQRSRVTIYRPWKLIRIQCLPLRFTRSPRELLALGTCECGDAPRS